MSTDELIREMNAMTWNIDLLRKYERLYLELELAHIIDTAKTYCDSCKNSHAAFHANPRNANWRFYFKDEVVRYGHVVNDAKRQYNETLERFKPLLEPEPDWQAYFAGRKSYDFFVRWYFLG